MWERALRRSGLPIAWSAGYSPRPLLSFGHALPTGAESLAEYLDMTLEQGGSMGHATDGGIVDRHGGLGPRLSSLLPDGLDVRAIAPVPMGSGSLQQEVSSCSWELEVLGLAADKLASRVERLLAAPTALVERERKGRSVFDDMHPALLDLEVLPQAAGVASEPTHEDRAWLRAELATRPRGVRPRELLEVLGPGVRLSRACRLQQWIERDGTRVEPLVVCGREAGTVAAHAEWRAT